MPLNDTHLLLLNAGLSVTLTGLIWTVQLVHYPLMAEVGPAAFGRYHHRHTARIVWLVTPLMSLELCLGAALPFMLSRPSWEAWCAGALVGLVWLSTALVQVPLHSRLARGLDLTTVRQLVRTNWARTLAWTARSLLLSHLLWRDAAG